MKKIISLMILAVSFIAFISCNNGNTNDNNNSSEEQTVTPAELLKNIPVTPADFAEMLGTDNRSLTRAAEPVLVKEFTVTDEGQTSFEFEGIDDGTYRLTETETPAGYNSIEPVEFVVRAAHTSEQVAGTYDATNEADDPELIRLSGGNGEGLIEFTADPSNDLALTANVVNQKGAILPSTGGMGTKVLYGAGGAMVLVAGVLLVTKRRMGEDK